MGFRSTKTYGHEVGLSCAFRQWRATHSHCQYLHGYALSVRLEFCAAYLDERNWVMDFGGLKSVKDWLQSCFDHKTVVAVDDPELEMFRELNRRGVIELHTMNNVGCEAFAQLIGDTVNNWLQGKPNAIGLFRDGTEDDNASPFHRLWLDSCEVREHGGNSAIYKLERRG